MITVGMNYHVIAGKQQDFEQKFAAVLDALKAQVETLTGLAAELHTPMFVGFRPAFAAEMRRHLGPRLGQTQSEEDLMRRWLPILLASSACFGGALPTAK